MLNGNQKELLLKALLARYYTRNELKRFLRFKLGKPLYHSGNLRDITFSVIEEFEADGQLEELINKADIGHHVDKSKLLPTTKQTPTMTNHKMRLSRVKEYCNLVIQKFPQSKSLTRVAKELRAAVNDYSDAKTDNELYDVNGDKLVKLEHRRQELQTLVTNKIKKRKAKIATEITKLLPTKSVPTWKNISKAYDLANGLGLDNRNLEKLIERESPRNENKNRAAGIIRDFAKGLLL